MDANFSNFEKEPALITLAKLVAEQNKGIDKVAGGEVAHCGPLPGSDPTPTPSPWTPGVSAQLVDIDKLPSIAKLAYGISLPSNK